MTSESEERIMEAAGRCWFSWNVAYEVVRVFMHHWCYITLACVCAAVTCVRVQTLKCES